MWDTLEELLIGADIGPGNTQEILNRLKYLIREQGASKSEDVLELLKVEMVNMLTVVDQRESPPLTDFAQGHSEKNPDGTPITILMVGVNGVGKTTSIAKLANVYVQQNKKVVIGAADTFRAGAIGQLQEWGRRLGVDVISHQQGADPAAVAFDAIEAAQSREAEVVIIDTAGRLHTKGNLMDEIKKIHRVASRQTENGSYKVILALDATTGQNGLAQASAFTKALDCDGVFLSKLDGTAKGGIVVSITHQLNLPILFVGTGEQPEDIAEFDPNLFVDALFHED